MATKGKGYVNPDNSQSGKMPNPLFMKKAAGHMAKAMGHMTKAHEAMHGTHKKKHKKA